MVNLLSSARNNFRNNNAAARSLLRRWRQQLSLILLTSVMCAPIWGIAQSKDQEKRGLGVTPTPKQTPDTAPSDTRSIKPELILQTGHTKSANAVAFSPDNRWLASGGSDDVIKIWDLATGNVLRTLFGHTSHVNALAISPDGTLLASGGLVSCYSGWPVRRLTVGVEANSLAVWRQHI